MIEETRKDSSVFIYKRRLSLPLRISIVVAPILFILFFSNTYFWNERILQILLIVPTLLFMFITRRFLKSYDLGMSPTEIVMPSFTNGEHTVYRYEDLEGYRHKSARGKGDGYLQLIARNGECYNIYYFSVHPWDKFYKELKEKIPCLNDPARPSDILKLWWVPLIFLIILGIYYYFRDILFGIPK